MCNFEPHGACSKSSSSLKTKLGARGAPNAMVRLARLGGHKTIAPGGGLGNSRSCYKHTERRANTKPHRILPLASALPLGATSASPPEFSPSLAGWNFCGLLSAFATFLSPPASEAVFLFCTVTNGVVPPQPFCRFAGRPGNTYTRNVASSDKIGRCGEKTLG